MIWQKLSPIFESMVFPLTRQRQSFLMKNALVMEDVASKDENRWILIGLSSEAQLLTVIYTVRDQFVRIISARKSTKKEAKYYA
jgi:uncharacterized DUF497 family protein